MNSVILGRIISEQRWWTRNWQIVSYLDEGRTVREITSLTDRGPRQIRVIRERLAEFRAQNRDEQVEAFGEISRSAIKREGRKADLLLARESGEADPSRNGRVRAWL